MRKDRVLKKRGPAVFETLSSVSAPQDWGVDVLAFGAHPDDVEIAMGGTLLALKARGARTVVCHLTDGEPTPYGNHKTRLKEAEAAARTLQLDDYLILPLKNRELQDTLAARRKVAEVIRRYRPRAIFAPYWVDAHPDHGAACALVSAGRFWAKLVKTDMKAKPWYPPKMYHHLVSHLRVNANPSFIVDVSDHLEGKLRALRCYKSQFLKNPASRALDHIELRNAYYGSQIGRKAGEPFFSLENVGVEDPRVLF
jgi:bacillithiol biosynthesis deacetylase BshB1